MELEKPDALDSRSNDEVGVPRGFGRVRTAEKENSRHRLAKTWAPCRSAVGPPSLAVDWVVCRRLDVDGDDRTFAELRHRVHRSVKISRPRT